MKAAAECSRNIGQPFKLSLTHSHGQDIYVHPGDVSVVVQKGIKGGRQMSGIPVIGRVNDINSFCIPIHIMAPISYILQSF